MDQPFFCLLVTNFCGIPTHYSNDIVNSCLADDLILTPGITFIMNVNVMILQ